ncbi:hypothetical protein D0864_03760 [Hortaea werneckii]|uniref:Uncharacterized protein n=1 Tax=Hortaea werneckii TaxID=91943 RepID=A0A3M7GHL2_HORWE|nr:hypothetical protein D0864_03760 [Hortaea werneckii]
MDLDHRPPKLVDIEFDFRHILLGSVDNLVKILADLAKRCRKPADKKPDLSGRWSADIISPYAWKELREQVGAVNVWYIGGGGAPSWFQGLFQAFKVPYIEMALVDKSSFQVMAYTLPGNDFRNVQQTLDLVFHSQTDLHSLVDEEQSAANLSSSQLLVIMRSDNPGPEKADSNSKMTFAWAALSVNKPGGNKAQFMQWFKLMSKTQLSDLQTQLAHLFSHCGMCDSPTPVTLDWDWEVYAAALKRRTNGGKPRYEDNDVIAHFEGAVLPRMLHMIRRGD